MHALIAVFQKNDESDVRVLLFGAGDDKVVAACIGAHSGKEKTM